MVQRLSWLYWRLDSLKPYILPKQGVMAVHKGHSRLCQLATPPSHPLLATWAKCFHSSTAHPLQVSQWVQISTMETACSLVFPGQLRDLWKHRPTVTHFWILVPRLVLGA